MIYFEFRLLCLLGEEYIRKGKRVAVIQFRVDVGLNQGQEEMMGWTQTKQ